MQKLEDLVLTSSEAAEILRVSVDTVCRRAEAGALPAIRKLPGRTGTWIFDARVVRRQALLDLLDQSA